jgi:hypothetical protein
MLRLAQVKTALADKYTHLATVVKSKPRQQKYLRQVEKHRRQAADLVTQAHAR